MQKIIGIVIAVALLGYGIVRVGVGSLLLAQLFELIQIADLATSIEDIRLFLEERQDKQLIPMSLSMYFAYIVIMGGLLIAGAIGVLYKKLAGFVLLAVYVTLHAALFLNYQEVNPKLAMVALQIVLFVVLYKIRRPDVAEDAQQSA